MADENSTHNRRAMTAIRHPIRCLIAALRFLTILPIFSSRIDDTAYFGGALFYFTITGIIAGTLAALSALLMIPFLPSMVIAVIMALTLSLVSGFFHLDGLADTADGFMSSRPRDECLEIMRDSRIGVMGAAAVSAVFLLKVAALTSIDQQELVFALVVTPAAGRTAIVLLMAVLPYARKEGGLGDSFYSGSTRWAAALSGLLLVLIVFVLVPQKLALIIAAVVFVTAGFSLLCWKKIGGATGDTLGAVCELTESLILVVFTLTLQT